MRFSIRPAIFTHHPACRLPSKPGRLNDVPAEFLPDGPSIKEAVHRLELTNSVEVKTCARLLRCCSRLKLLKEGKKIHHHILKNDSDISSNTVLLEEVAGMYLSCDEIELARAVFNEIHEPSIFLWNSVIRSYAWHGPFEEAINLYYHLVRSGRMQNKFTFPFVLKACSNLLALEDARKIHSHVRERGLEWDLFISTALVDIYAKCGALQNAFILFNKMSQRDVVAWNAMIAGFSLHGCYEDAVRLFTEMQRNGISPNSSTAVSILSAIAMAKNLSQGKGIHGYCIRRYLGEDDALVKTALLDMYAKCDYLPYSRRIFENMTTKNDVTWSAMIGALVLSNQMTEAMTVFRTMMSRELLDPSSSTMTGILRACASLTDLDRGKQLHAYSAKSGLISDIAVANSLLSLYAKVSALDDVGAFFGEMNLKDSVSYSAVMSGCVQNGSAEVALYAFYKMQMDIIEVDTATMVAVIPACANLAALQLGRCTHGYVTVNGFASDLSISNSIIDMYSKCGRIDLARCVFNHLSERDIVSWNAIIAGYGIHGLGNEALSLFRKLLISGLKPDDVTFICLLSACCHSGLVTEGKRWFDLMDKEYKIIPRMEHYICVVDLLGRAGHLEEAYNFVQQMPFEPDVRVLGALLGACRIHNKVRLSEEVSRLILKLGPEGTGNFVLLSNIYSAAGRWDDAANIRTVQKDMGFKKSPGCSWTEIHRIVHAFTGGDRTHPHSLSIYEKLAELLSEMKCLGYEPDISCVLHDVEEEEKEHILLCHSEKLAIAYGLLSLNSNTPITVTKNLRVCGDCHTSIKFITMITKRAITIRDASRFHHFSDGMCNCGDFW